VLELPVEFGWCWAESTSVVFYGLVIDEGTHTYWVAVCTKTKQPFPDGVVIHFIESCAIMH